MKGLRERGQKCAYMSTTGMCWVGPRHDLEQHFVYFGVLTHTLLCSGLTLGTVFRDYSLKQGSADQLYGILGIKAGSDHVQGPCTWLQPPIWSFDLWYCSMNWGCQNQAAADLGQLRGCAWCGPSCRVLGVGTQQGTWVLGSVALDGAFIGSRSFEILSVALQAEHISFWSFLRTREWWAVEQRQWEGRTPGLGRDKKPCPVAQVSATVSLLSLGPWKIFTCSEHLEARPGICPVSQRLEFKAELAPGLISWIKGRRPSFQPDNWSLGRSQSSVYLNFHYTPGFAYEVKGEGRPGAEEREEKWVCLCGNWGRGILNEVGGKGWKK